MSANRKAENLDAEREKRAKKRKTWTQQLLRLPLTNEALTNIGPYLNLEEAKRFLLSLKADGPFTKGILRNSMSNMKRGQLVDLISDPKVDKESRNAAAAALVPKTLVTTHLVKIVTDPTFDGDTRNAAAKKLLPRIRQARCIRQATHLASIVKIVTDPTFDEENRDAAREQLPEMLPRIRQATEEKTYQNSDLGVFSPLAELGDLGVTGDSPAWQRELTALEAAVTRWLDEREQRNVGPYPGGFQRPGQHWNPHDKVWTGESDRVTLKERLHVLHLHHVAQLGKDLGIRGFDWYEDGSINLSKKDGSINLSKKDGSINLSKKDLTSLPESIGALTVGGDLLLSYNRELRSLPASFGNLTVGGDLILDSNCLCSLPESFGNLTVGGYLHLGFNRLTSLPENFGDITVGGGIVLSWNIELTSLPESFGNLTVGGNPVGVGIDLSPAGLKSLPESFGNLTVEGDLVLKSNSLTSLPESFGNLTVEGDLNLQRNLLSAPPPRPAKLQGELLFDPQAKPR